MFTARMQPTAAQYQTLLHELYGTPFHDVKLRSMQLKHQPQLTFIRNDTPINTSMQKLQNRDNRNDSHRERRKRGRKMMQAKPQALRSPIGFRRASQGRSFDSS